MNVHVALWGLTTFVFAIGLATSAVSGEASRAVKPHVPAGRANPFVAFFEWFGNLALFSGQLLRAAVTPPFEAREFLHQLDELGFKSLPLVALAGAATGVVLTLSTRDSLVRFGAKSFLPAVVCFSIIKESGPIITGLIVSGRAAAGIGAELGAMKVTEQIDAIEASAVNPFNFLVATRVLACIVMLPLLTLVADFCGILMGWVANTLTEPITLQLFLHDGMNSVQFSDLLPSTFKTMVFGLIIGVVSCFQGMNTRGGTEGVERAATSSVVLASLLIIMADVLLVRVILAIWG
jgi:phospholipid/cholesterol/gamma-HCH transport system permease protein